MIAYAGTLAVFVGAQGQENLDTGGTIPGILVQRNGYDYLTVDNFKGFDGIQAIERVELVCRNLLPGSFPANFENDDELSFLGGLAASQVGGNIWTSARKIIQGNDSPVDDSNWYVLETRYY